MSRYAELVRTHKLFQRDELTSAQFHQLVAGSYQQFLRGAQSLPDVRSLADEELVAAYKAAELVSFYTSAPAHARELAAAAAELQRRGKADAKQIEKTYHMLLAARLASDAAAWGRRNGLTGGVTLSDAGDAAFVGPTVLAMTGPGSTMVRESFAVRGKQLIAVTHPSCHFSGAALSAIFYDAVLLGRLRGNMTLLTPQQSEADLRDFKQWNSAHPQDQFKMAYAMADWPMLTSWDTPIFYFLHDGVVVDQVHGWPRDSDNLAALRLALDRLERR